MLMSYLKILQNIPCSLLGAHLNSFLAMTSKGLWPLSMLTGLPHVYCSNLSSAKTTARSSFSICTYLDSVSVRAWLSKATGGPFCSTAARSPFSLVSHWIVNSYSGLSYLRSGDVVAVSLIRLKAASCSWVHFHSFSLQVRLCVRCSLTNQSSTESRYFLHHYELTFQPILMKLQH